MMRRRVFVTVFLIFSASKGMCQQIVKDTIKIFYMGGQSNMDGYGFNADLPDNLKEGFKNVWIFHGNPAPDESENGGWGKWDDLMPGHGVGFSSNDMHNTLSDRFGVELSFATRLRELFPNEKIGIIKYSRGGSSIDSLAAGQFGSWEPDYSGSRGINQYDHFLTTIRKALDVDDINNDGKEDYLLPQGIIWMQGESDAAYTEDIAMRYYQNLKRLMDLIRASLRVDDLPIVMGKISDSFKEREKTWEYGELVQYAQEKYARKDKNAAIVRSTRYYQYSDQWHYNSDGYLDLGVKFAEAIYRLIKK